MVEDTWAPWENLKYSKSLATFSHARSKALGRCRQRVAIGSTLDHSAIGADPGSGERQQAVSGNALGHLAIRVGPDSVERQQAVSGNALDHSAIKAGPQW